MSENGKLRNCPSRSAPQGSRPARHTKPPLDDNRLVSAPCYGAGMQEMRLRCALFWVDVRLRQIDAAWVASADTPDGPSLGLGMTASSALQAALRPFAPLEDELLGSASSGHEDLP